MTTESCCINDSVTVHMCEAIKIYLHCMNRASSNSTLPVTLVSKNLHQANDDSIDVAIEALKAEGCQVAACPVAWNGLVRAHQYQPLMHLK
jgi:mannose-1-phosphate guanylyltransferase